MRCFKLAAAAYLFMAIASGAWAGGGGFTFSVRAFGAKADGVTDDTKMVQCTIDACAKTGGTVTFGAGTYLCGSLHLRSNVTLHLENGATILGSAGAAAYDPIEKLDFKNDADVETSFFHFALIWGEDLENVAIEGHGTIDCNRTKRHGPKGIALKRCKNVSIRDVRLMNCPNYNISLLGCDYVNIDGVTILNGYADGIDPDACHNVRIANCHIESRDDAIVPKTSFSLGEHRSTENVTVTNCVLATECCCFKLGTESGGDFKYITVSNCVMTGLPGMRPATAGIALESVDGSNVDGVTVSNCAMNRVDTPIFLRLGNRGRDMEEHVPGTLRNVCIDNITANEAGIACSITGIPDHPIEGVTLSNLRLSFRRGGPFCAAETPMPELIDHYPDADMFDALPSYGFYVRHVRGLRMTNVDLALEKEFAINREDEKARKRREEAKLPEPVQNTAGHAILCDDVADLALTGFSAAVGPDGLAPIRLTNVRGAVLRDCAAPPGARSLLDVAGGATSGIRVLDPILPDGVDAVAGTKGMGKHAVTVRQ